MAAAPEIGERGDTARPGTGGYDTQAWGTPLDGLARLVMRVPWLWPALLTFMLGCYQVDRPELWRDELWSWSFASDPVRALLSNAGRSNSAEVAYDLLLHYWMAAFGDSVLAMRMLSVLAMAGAAAVVTLAGRRLAGAWAGLLSGLVFAVLPSVSRFAQEVRFYAPEVLAVSLATLLLLRTLDRPFARRWMAYGVCLAVVGYLDVVALSVVIGHAVGVALRWWQDRDGRLFGFVPAAAAGTAACVPLVALSWGRAGFQVWWASRPGLDAYAFSSFSRNLFFSTAVAAAIILLAVLAWAAWRPAAFATAVAVLPAAAVWLLSQGPHSYFVARYLLFTAGAWAILAGLALSRIDRRVAAAAVLVIAIFGAGDQQVIRQPGAHSWPDYPVSGGGYYWDYADAASLIAGNARPGDGIVYRAGWDYWELIGPGVQYYLRRDMPHGVPVPRELFVTDTSPQSSQIDPPACRDPAACLGDAPRVWIVGSGYVTDPFSAIADNRAAVLAPDYVLSLTKHFQGLTVFLLVRYTDQGSPG